MGTNSKIEWTEHTFNGVRGCVEVSPACQNCYARVLSGRNPNSLGTWGSANNGGRRVVAAEKYWDTPKKWNKWANAGTCYACAGRGKVKQAPVKNAKLVPCERCVGLGSLGGPYTANVFAFSLADVFECWNAPMHDTSGKVIPGMTFDRVRARLLELIYDTRYLNWLLLTKRTDEILPFLNRCSAYGKSWGYPRAETFALEWLSGNAPENVFLGTTVENQTFATMRVPTLLHVPAALHFLSCEPMLERLQLQDIFLNGNRQIDALNGIDEIPGRYRVNINKIRWVIAGGESGTNARPMNPSWVRELRKDCVSAKTLFHFKQWGEWGPRPDGSRLGNVSWKFDGDAEPTLWRTGTDFAGRELDGRTWDERPERKVVV